jgi:hypothetical protein
MTTAFTHLHVHSHYSLLDGAIDIDGLVGEASRLGMGSLALTDHGNLFGSIEFYVKARKAGINPILGCEAYLVNGDATAPREERQDAAPSRDAAGPRSQGWENSRAFRRCGSRASAQAAHDRPCSPAPRGADRARAACRARWRSRCWPASSRGPRVAQQYGTSSGANLPRGHEHGAAQQP